MLTLQIYWAEVYLLEGTWTAPGVQKNLIKYIGRIYFLAKVGVFVLISTTPADPREP